MRRYQRSDLTKHVDSVLIYGSGLHLLISVGLTIMLQFFMRDNSSRELHEMLVFFFAGILNPALVALAIAAVGGCIRMAAIFVLGMKTDDELEVILGPSRSDRKARKLEHQASLAAQARESMQPETSEIKT